MGLRLATLNRLTNIEAPLSNLRRNDQNVEAELTALYLIHAQDPCVELELELPVGTRRADFRVRKQGEGVWTTVEVTQAMPSEYEKHLYDILKKILDSFEESTIEFSLEVIFRREFVV